MREALCRRRAVLHRAAHSLKSSSANLGALATVRSLRRVGNNCGVRIEMKVLGTCRSHRRRISPVRAALEMELTSRADLSSHKIIMLI